MPHLEAFQAIQAINACPTDGPGLTPEDNMDTPIAIQHAGFGNFADALAKHGLLRAPRSIQIHRSVDSQHTTGASCADREGNTKMVN
jgi:hypothetical protein